MGQMDARRVPASARRGTLGRSLGVVAATVLGLVAPLFVSSPLSATDVRGGAGTATSSICCDLAASDR